MEKISSIVKGSSRVSSVDLKNAPPVRPGTPGFGRPTGSVTAGGSDHSTTAERAVGLHKEILEARRSEAERSQIVRDMADKFFLTQYNEPEGVDPQTGIQNQIVINIPGAKAATAPEVKSKPDEAVAAPEREWIPPGTYLDVNV